MSRASLASRRGIEQTCKGIPKLIYYSSKVTRKYFPRRNECAFNDSIFPKRNSVELEQMSRAHVRHSRPFTSRKVKSVILPISCRILRARTTRKWSRFGAKFSHKRNWWFLRENSKDYFAIGMQKNRRVLPSWWQHGFAIVCVRKHLTTRSSA